MATAQNSKSVGSFLPLVSGTPDHLQYTTMSKPEAGGGLLEKLLAQHLGLPSADRRGDSALWAVLSEDGTLPAPTSYF